MGWGEKKGTGLIEMGECGPTQANKEMAGSKKSRGKRNLTKNGERKRSGPRAGVPESEGG